MLKFYRNLAIIILSILWVDGICWNVVSSDDVGRDDTIPVVKIHLDSLMSIATVENPSPNNTYTFEWYDSSLGQTLRKQTKRNEYSDTLNNLRSEHNYLVKVLARNQFDSGEIKKKFTLGSDTGWQKIYVYCYAKELNIITPNGDDYNDTWGIEITNEVYYELTIYNGWGEKVFESYCKEYVWDGRMQKDGSKCPDGIYYFKFIYKLTGHENESNIETKGSVDLITVKPKWWMKTQ